VNNRPCEPNCAPNAADPLHFQLKHPIEANSTTSRFCIILVMAKKIKIKSKSVNNAGKKLEPKYRTPFIKI